MQTEPRAPTSTPRSPFATQWSRFDRMFGALDGTLAEAARIDTGAHVIDVGAGAGGTALALAARVGPMGQVVAVDIDPDCVQIARRRAAELRLDNVKFLVADAEHHVFFDGAADAVVSRMGAHHFQDPVAAMRNLKHSLREGGRVAFAASAAPEKNAWAWLPLAAAKSVIPNLPPPPSDGRGPFTWADPAQPRAILTAAGFHDAAIDPIELDVCIGADAEDAVDFFEQTHAKKIARGLDAPTRLAMVDALRDRLAPYVQENGVHVPATTWIVSARA